MAKNSIPKEDLDLINKSFQKTESVDTISKKGMAKVVSVKKEEVNKVSHTIRSTDFRGRVLKHAKSLIPVGGTQLLIGKKGQLFDDIPEEQRKRIMWSESDFE